MKPTYEELEKKLRLTQRWLIINSTILFVLSNILIARGAK